MARPKLKPGEQGEPSAPAWNESRGVWQQSCLIGEPIGRPTRVWASGPTKTKCTAALRKRVAEWKPRGSSTGTYSPDCTVLDAARAWLKSREQQPKTRMQTIDNYRREIDATAKGRARRPRITIEGSEFGGMRAADVRPMHVRVYLESMNELGAKQAMHKTILTQTFDLLVDDGVMDANPVRSVRGRAGELAAPSRPRPEGAANPWFADEPEPFKPEEYAKFLRLEEAFFAARPRFNRRFQDVRQLAYQVAGRPGEVLAVRWSDIDLDAGTVEITGTVVSTEAPVATVRRSLKRFGLADDEVGIREDWRELPDDTTVSVLFRQPYPKTRLSRRIIKVDAATVAMLRRRKLAAAPGTDLVFTPTRGDRRRPLYPQAISDVWAKIVAGSGLEWSVPRTLRSTRATRIAEAHGIPAARLILGHEEGSAVTTRHYVVLEPTVVDFADAQ